MRQNFSEKPDLNLSKQHFNQIWPKVITSLIIALFASYILVTDNCQPVLAEEAETQSSSVSKEGTPKNTTKNRQGNPQIIMSVPPGWGETYKREMGKVSVYDAHEKKGNEYMRDGKYDLALAEFQTTLQLAEKTDIIGIMSAHRNLAKAFEAMAKYPDASDHVQFLTEHTQSDIARSDYLSWKGAIDAASRGEFDEAIQIYKTLLATAEDWERPSIKLRLHLMEERARTAGQLPVASSSIPSDPKGKVVTGTVKWFSDPKGYGFITPDNGKKDVFVHYTGIVGSGFKTLREGEKVEFEIIVGPKGEQASSVKRLQGGEG